jgi:glycosyltransferase involved in cell wall biosynthesis
MLEQVRRRAHEFDILHFHIDLLHGPLLRMLPTPAVTTLHGRQDLPDLLPFYRAFPDMPLVSISDDQRRPLPPANWMATIPHGMPVDLLPFRPGPGSYLAFLGRISPEKGLDRAIAIARRAGLKLRVAAKLYPEERGYFQQTIEPLLDASRSWVDFVGEVGGREKDEFLGNARALLFPIDWPEPFGLVMIEAMACGTPVVAWRNGSVPEVMEDGVTGFIVDSVDAAVRAVGRVGGLSRRACREVFEKRFDAARMARDYLEVYRRLAHSSAGLVRPVQRRWVS